MALRSVSIKREVDTKGLAERIPGWGADLAPENRPGVPKEKAPPQGTGAHWDEPARQISDVKIFKTIERSELTPVFGTTCPPKGLSGLLRDIAYRFGEARMARWLILLLADRVDVVETISSDIVKGCAQNPLKEMGLKAELEEPRRVAYLVTGVAAAVGALVALRRSA
jgi:hypothetical protein